MPFLGTCFYYNESVEDGKKTLILNEELSSLFPCLPLNCYLSVFEPVAENEGQDIRSSSFELATSRFNSSSPDEEAT